MLPKLESVRDKIKEAQIEALPDLVYRLRTNFEIQEAQISKLENDVAELRAKLQTKKLKQFSEKALYFLPLALAIGITAYLIHRGWAEKVSVSIDYNVGEIIGGLLVGIGVLVAGAAYALRRTGE